MELPPARAANRRIWPEMREGLRHVAHTPILRSLAGATGCGNIFDNARAAVLVLYMHDDLGLGAGAIGLVYAAGSVGYFFGAFLPAWAARRFGLGRTIVGAMGVIVLGELVFPISTLARPLAVPLLVIALFIVGFAAPAYDVNQFSLRQAITPDALLGRTNASMRVLIRGAVPIGALLGGLIGEAFGLRAVLVFGAFGGISSLLWLWRSPVPSLRSLPR
jgi:predicted MFS family arabinose efflux permease